MSTIYTVTDWLGHALYSFATEREAAEYVRRYDPHQGTLAGMHVRSQQRKPYHRVVELPPQPIGNRIAVPI